jgi:CRISPR/Cas system type I-B associated protein Csh2 (Cas7 group RAMP superfamily)
LIPATTINHSGNEDIISSEKLQKELETEKKKVIKLKEKLKLANEKIIDLMQYKVKAQAAGRLP